MRKLLQSLLALSLAVTAGCEPAAPPADVRTDARDDAAGLDMDRALAALPRAEVVDVAEDGTPTFVRGELGKLGDVGALGQVTAQARARDTADALAPVFGARGDELELLGSTVDAFGHTHVRYAQRLYGVPVVGGELRLHADARGVVFLANGRVFRRAAHEVATVAAEAAALAARDASGEVRHAEASTLRLVYAPDASGRLSLAWETQVTGVRADDTEVRDLVYVSARSGAVLDRVSQIHSALNRALYSANNGTSLPGTLRRSEGGATTGDATIDQNYDHLGTTYNCYKTLFNRDSYNNAGAQMKSSVHYSTNYVNAYWNGTQMVYGDGDGSQSGPLGRDLDVTVHELTHAVTSSESNLTYSNESGALNEAMSDIFAAVCESWVRGGATDNDVFKIGEDIWTPATAGDALRYMYDPALAGDKDYYPTRYTGTSDSGGVHTNSGIANLAFTLMVRGGTHPRNATTVSVTGIGMTKAAQVMYYANSNIMTASTNFAGARTATVQAASALGYDAATQTNVGNAWAAVGVGTAGGGGSTATSLTNGVAVAVSGASGSQTHYKIAVPSGQAKLVVALSGGTGDADLYVNFGTQASTTTYSCRPYLSGNNETCTINNPSAGDWYVMLNGYSAYSGASLKATYSTSTTTSPQLNVSNISGATGSVQNWTLSVPAGASTLTFKTTGGTGDADMYVKLGSAPTSTTDTGIKCKSEGSTTVETCTISAPASGTWYVQLRGYTSFSGVTLTGQY